MSAKKLIQRQQATQKKRTAKEQTTSLKNLENAIRSCLATPNK